MRLESDSDRTGSFLSGAPASLPQQLLVRQVNAVKHADGRHAALLLG
jgi:hypothetical protein